MRTIVLIIVVIATFWLWCTSAFLRCISIWLSTGNFELNPFFLIYGSREFSFHGTCLQISRLVIVFTESKYTFPCPGIELTITVTKFINQHFTPPGYCPVDEDNSPDVHSVDNDNFSSKKFKEKCCSLL